MRKLIALGALCLVALAIPGIAKAWKPYTHNYTGIQARNDAVDGSFTLGGCSYSVPAPVRQALADWPTYFNAGVVGPDAYPDLTMGEPAPAAGRLVLLCAPAGYGAWGGALRLVGYVSAELGPEMAGDPLLPECG